MKYLSILCMTGIAFGMPASDAFAQSNEPVTGARSVIEKVAESKKIRIIAKVKSTTAAGERLAPDAVVRTKNNLEATMRSAGATVANQIPETPLVVLEVNEDQLEQLIASGQIDQVQEDVIEQPYLTQSIPLINVPAAWAAGARGAGEAVAILDTGVEASHPFFNGRVISEACYSSNVPSQGASSVCPNGSATQTGAGAAAPCAPSSCDHGTHVAGIAAGRSNSFSGVAPDASIIAIQVFSRFDDVPGDPSRQVCANARRPSPCALTYRSDQIRGLQRVLELQNNGTKIASANMSLGGGQFNNACDADLRKSIVDQLRAAGVATVIASGNDGFNDAVGAPGCISTAVTVGSTTKSDGISSFSNHSSVVDLLAPGSSINASVVNGNFGFKSGTSMATPHVAGAFAALRSGAPTASIDQIQSALANTGAAISSPRNNPPRRRINVKAALDALTGTQQPTPGSPQLWIAGFGKDAGGWRVDRHPRMMADVNGDGKDDIVGFGNDGVKVSTSNGSSFDPASLWVSDFGYNAGGWRVDRHPRMMADVNGDGKADIVGFGDAGAYVAISTGSSFSPARLWIYGFGYNAGGWRVDRHPRMMADVNGDGKADIVGFGYSGIYVSTSTGTSFNPARRWVRGYGIGAGGWTVDGYPRLMADVNEDGRADVVGFGYSGVFVSTSTGHSFSPPSLWVNAYGRGSGAGGWRTDRHARLIGDPDKDGKADLVGFGNDGVHISASTGSSFAPPSIQITDFGYNTGDWQVDRHPRLVTAGRVAGFGNDGVVVADSNGPGTNAFTPPSLSINSFGYNAGDWRVEDHPRFLSDVTGDGKADVVGFGNDGVYVAEF